MVHGSSTVVIRIGHLGQDDKLAALCPIPVGANEMTLGADIACDRVLKDPGGVRESQ